MERLFCDSTGIWYGCDDIKNVLNKLKVGDCEILFVHSDISFGLPNREMRRNEYLDALFQTIADTGVRTIIYPTFTYSFCNGEPFDICNSKTSMGSLNEYARKQAGESRSLDPLLSVAVFGDKKEEFINTECECSLGENSVFDILHRKKNVKFLFFGAEFSNCFTYVHYVEKMMDVPYRFDMVFEGEVIDWEGNRKTKKQSIHTACEKIVPKDFYHFKDFLIAEGCLKVEKLGDREIGVIDEKSAYYWVEKKINERMDYFLEKPFGQDDLKHIYTYSKENGRITHC